MNSRHISESSEPKFYRVALDIPTRLGERGIVIARSPFSLMSGDLVKVSGRLGVVLGESDAVAGRVVEEVITPGYLPPKVVAFFEKLSTAYAIPFFALVRGALGTDLGFEKVLMGLVFHGKYEGRSVYLRKIFEILRDRGVLTYGELMNLVGGDRQKASRYWREVCRRGWAEPTAVVRLYLTGSGGERSGRIWLKDTENGRLLPLWTWNKRLGRKEVHRLLRVGRLVPAQVVAVDDRRAFDGGYSLSYVIGFVDELIREMRAYVDDRLSVVVTRSDATASWLARRLAGAGMPVVWHPGIGDKRMLLEMLIARIPGIYIGPPSILISPWLSVDRLFAFDVDDTFLTMSYADRYYEIHAFGVVDTFSRVFDVPLVWVSPLPVLAVYRSGRKVMEVSPNAEFSYHNVPKQGALADGSVREISRVLSAGGRVLVVVGRTGYRTVRLCEQCGYVQRCPVCGGVMVYHAKENTMICHRCGHREEPLLVCPVCGGLDFKMLGVGVELVEAELSQLFGAENVVVVSGERKEYVRRVLKSRIVVATQALFGSKYPYYNFDLVVVVSVDHLWALGKFDVLERAVRFVRRLAYLGRRVVIQTVMPDEWKGLLEESASEFLSEEAQARRVGGVEFPPFSRLFRIRWVATGSGLPVRRVVAALKKDERLSVFQPEHERFMGRHVLYVDVLSPPGYVSPVMLALASDPGFVGLRSMY